MQFLIMLRQLAEIHIVLEVENDRRFRNKRGRTVALRQSVRACILPRADLMGINAWSTITMPTILLGYLAA